MATAKLTAEWNYDQEGKLNILTLKKKRGKITVEEIGDFLRYSPQGAYQGNWALIIRAGDQTCGVSGWMDDFEDSGDVVDLYQLEDGEKCPICRKLLPPQYCPECGADLRKERSE